MMGKAKRRGLEGANTYTYAALQIMLSTVRAQTTRICQNREELEARAGIACSPAVCAKISVSQRKEKVCGMLMSSRPVMQDTVPHTSRLFCGPWQLLTPGPSDLLPGFDNRAKSLSSATPD